MERNKDLKPSGPNTQGFSPTLVPMSAKESLIIRLFDHYGERYNANRLETYLEDLSDVGLDDLEAAIKSWRRDPENRRAPSTGQLLARVRSLQPKPETRIEPGPPTSPQELDAIYAELARQNPHNTTLQERIRERARLKAQGVKLGGAAEVQALVQGLDGGDRT